MSEVEIRGENLNGLGWTLKSLLDDKLDDPGIKSALARLSGTLVVTETGAGVSSTLFFQGDSLEIADGGVDKPTAWLSGEFDQLSELISGQVGPVRALITRRIKAGGNLLKLLAMAKVIISKEARQD
jgi:putative sterol carrier protein